MSLINIFYYYTVLHIQKEIFLNFSDLLKVKTAVSSVAWLLTEVSYYV